MKKKKYLLKAIPVVIGVIIIFGIAFLLQKRNFNDQGRASTNVIVGRLITKANSVLCTKCVQQCPAPDNVLRDCNPMASYGISIDSMCNQAGRVESCGTTTFCCPAPNARWTKDLTKCPNVTPPAKTPYSYLILKPGGVCTALVVSKTLADPLLNKQVVATGTLKEPYFYASQLVEDKPGCDATQRDTPVTAKLKFPKTGKVAIFTMSPVQFRADIVLTGPKNITLGDVLIDNKVAKVSKAFDVVAGEEYTYSFKVIYPSPVGKKAAYGWIPPAEVGKCGPKKSPGKDKCGVLWDIKPLIDYAKANSSSITGIKAGVNEANVGCWADPRTNNPLEDYDYNDWAIVFGYVGSQPTPTTTSTPTIAPPTPGTNRLPYFTTSQLPSGVVKNFYSGYITAEDADMDTKLEMSITGLPAGLMVGPCAVPFSGGKISCYISGEPTASGYFTVSARVTDSKAGTASKSFGLSILPPSTPTPTPTP